MPERHEARSIGRLPLRHWLRRALICATLVVLGALPWPGLRSGFNHTFSSASNLILENLQFGTRGHAQLVSRQTPLAEVSIRLTVDGAPGEWNIERSLRKFAYLPLLLVLSTIAAAPLRPRRKLVCLVVGAGLSLGLSLASIWLTIVYSFTHGLRGVYEIGPFGMKAIELGMRTFVMPSALWKMGPLLLGLLVIWLEIAFNTPRSTLAYREP